MRVMAGACARAGVAKELTSSARTRLRSVIMLHLVARSRFPGEMETSRRENASTQRRYQRAPRHANDKPVWAPEPVYSLKARAALPPRMASRSDGDSSAKFWMKSTGRASRIGEG